MWWDTDGYGHMSGWGMGWGGGLFMLLLLLALVAVVVAVVVAVMRTSGDSGASTRPDADSDAVRLLEARFARGEIDEQDYLRRRSLLSR